MELKSYIKTMLLVLPLTLIAISCKNSTNSKASVDYLNEKDTTYSVESSATHSVDSSVIRDLYQHLRKEATGANDNPNSVSNMPPYYEKGYEAGYDDGEEDALNENGWETSYDDSNHYKGKKKRQYEDGYEEGYEAGYDDNHEGPDD